MIAEEIIGIVKEIVEQGGGGGGSVEKITLSAESGTLSNEDWTKLRASDGNILQIKVSDTNIRSFRYATSYGSYVYYVYVSENVDEQAEVEIIAINAGTLVYETRTLALGGGGVQYVDELPTTGSANTLYILSGGNKARNILKDRGTSGTKRY